MTQNTYPDGFPLTPLEAIDFSYTFSNEEKNEWREWVKTATAEQQQELVDTLHSIWIENQKEVVPAGFTKTEDAMQSQAEPQKAEAQVVDTNVIPVAKPSINIKNTPEVSINTQQNVNTKQENKQPVIDKSTEKQFVFNEKPSLNVPLKPVEVEKPAVVNRIETPGNQQNNSNYNQNNQDNRQGQSQNSSNSTTNSNSQVKSTMNFFDFAKVRESSTRNELEKLQKEFVVARQKRYEMEQTYASQLSNLINETDQKQQILFDKIVQISLNFENVADYLQSMTEKLLQTNESNIALEKKVKSLEIILDEKIKNLSYDKDNTQHDIDRLFRETRETRESLRGEILDIKRTSSVSTVDSFGDDGIKLKLGILANKLTALENNIQSQENQQRPAKLNPQMIKNKNENLNLDKKADNSTPKPSQSEGNRVLDISDIV